VPVIGFHLGRSIRWPSQIRGGGSGLRARVAFGFLMVGILFLGSDHLHLSPANATASAYQFSIVQWELANLPRKWLHLLTYIVPGRKPTREERLAAIDEYLLVARLAQKEKDRLEGRAGRSSSTLAAGAGRDSSASREYLDELLEDREALRAEAEEGMEAELSAAFIEEGMASRVGFLFPPVDLRFDRPPTIFITSPRDRIKREEAMLLEPEIPVLDRDRLENELLNRYDRSALVDDLAGLSTYPSLVSELSPLRSVLQTAAHEWLHHYFFFRPLGWSIGRSSEMFTLSETASDLAGRELGDIAFARMGGDLSVSSHRYLSSAERYPNITREMRETRLEVERLLAEGRVGEAEEYMKERWWFLALRGFRLRKLNQAYFAFHGTYAESPASISPIGGQLAELRSLVPGVGEFVRTVAGLSSYPEFLALLESLRPPEQVQPTASATSQTSD